MVGGCVGVWVRWKGGKKNRKEEDEKQKVQKVNTLHSCMSKRVGMKELVHRRLSKEL